MTGRNVAILATTVVAAVAAIVSYDHMRVLAERAGESWKSFLIPLAIDGMVVAASTVLLARRRAGRPGGALAWLALLGGVAVSLAANAAAAQPTVVGRAVALVPPLALAVSFELVRSIVTATPARRPSGTQSPPTTSATASPTTSPGDRPSTPPSPAEPAQPAPVDTASFNRASSDTASFNTASGDTAPSDTAPSDTAPSDTAPSSTAPPSPAPSLESRAAELMAAGDREGRPIGRARLARELGITQYQARQLLATVGSTTSQSTNGSAATQSTNGHRSAQT